jgi:hypothetical protein
VADYDADSAIVDSRWHGIIKCWSVENGGQNVWKFVIYVKIRWLFNKLDWRNLNFRV